MKTEVIVKGWKYGFAKISFTKLVKENTGFGLAEAKKVTDDILEGTESILFFKNEEIALAFIEDASNLGCICVLKPNGMSVVTNIILTFGTAENEAEVTKQLANFTYQMDLVSIDDDKLPQGWYGGNKMFEGNVWLGAFNYFPTTNFMNYLSKDMIWEARENVVVFIQEEHEERFKMITLDF